MRLALWLLLFGASYSIPVRSAPAPSAPQSVRSEDVLTLIEQTVGWYRHINASQSSTGVPGDLLFRNSARQTSIKAVQLTFDWARAEAALLASNGSATNSGGEGQSLQEASTKAAQRVAGLQARISELEAAMGKAAPSSRKTIAAQRDELQAELDLAKEVQSTIQNLVNFTGNAGSGAGGGLAAQIDALERSVPEARRSRDASAAAAANSATNAVAAAAGNAPPFSPQDAGIVALFTELFRAHGNVSQLDDLINETGQLLQGIDRLRDPLRNEVKGSIDRGDQIANAAGSQDTAQLAAAQSELKALASNFKQFSAVLVPLGEESMEVETSRGILLDWRNAVYRQFAETGRYLVIRGVTLAIWIGIVLVISEVWRRATFRYVQDSRRRRQVLVLRRIVVACGITFAVIMALISEFGSLATYAGFVTAGLAVALQNVILSVVAYFFLIGRYGVRVGDRVTITGVTGNVIDIGLMRIYLMELAGNGPDLRPTGRIVVYSNSVIFQPTALFKQVPGTDYVWHTLTLTLAPTS
ncbi:MAG: mechanosensitive ion channel family protein, partial [Bryobacteraceae bacterium]